MLILYEAAKNTYLSGKSAFTYGALEGTFFSVAAIMYFERRVAGECLVADATRSIATHCTQINQYSS